MEQIVGFVEVEILGLESDDFPIWIKCKLTALDGSEHLIIEKLPVLTEQELNIENLPAKLQIECTVLSIEQEQVVIDLSSPHGIQSIEGVQKFVVHSSLYHAT
jgi:oligoribonuclease (3'-5' exoribonuclease)